MLKMKEKEANYAIDKFNNDFEEIRKQVINQINLALSEMKARFLVEIRERCMIETTEEVKLRASIDDFLTVINNHLSGLKKGRQVLS
jgi:hypothetical protein